MNRILIVPVLLWLLVVAWQDARQQTVANGLTLPPLFLAAFLWLARGAWAVGLLLALLLIAGEVLERLRLPTAMGIGPLILAAGGLAHAAPPDVQLILVAWFCAWAAWALHLAGGADAKVLMALVAFFPDPLLAALLVAAQVAWSVYHLIRRYRGRALQVALTGTLSRPTQEELDAHGVPLLPAYAAAGAAFFLARCL